MNALDGGIILSNIPFKEARTILLEDENHRDSEAQEMLGQMIRCANEAAGETCRRTAQLSTGQIAETQNLEQINSPLNFEVLFFRQLIHQSLWIHAYCLFNSFSILWLK